MAKSKHIRYDFDHIQREKGILEDVNARTEKRTLTTGLSLARRQRGHSEAALARRMGTSRTVVRSLLDPSNASATLLTVARAAHAVGRTVEVHLRRPRRTAAAPRRRAADK